jgi:urease accessory protein
VEREFNFAPSALLGELPEGLRGALLSQPLHTPSFLQLDSSVPAAKSNTTADGPGSAPKAKAKEQHMKKILVSLMSFVTLVQSAEAHVGPPGHAHDVVSGFMHPIGGVDHVLAMVAVGVFAAMLGGRARWALPLSFVAMMLLGGLSGFAGFNVPYVEIGIAASVIAFGLVIALEWKAPVALAAALVGLFAVFHGVAHGAEMPADASIYSYALGFASATALLHVVGLGLGFSLLRFAKVSGIAIALAGLGMASGLV